MEKNTRLKMPVWLVLVGLVFSLGVLTVSARKVRAQAEEVMMEEEEKMEGDLNEQSGEVTGEVQGVVDQNQTPALQLAGIPGDSGHVNGAVDEYGLDQGPGGNPSVPGNGRTE